MNQNSHVNVSESSVQYLKVQEDVNSFLASVKRFLFLSDGFRGSCFSVLPGSLPGGEDGLGVLRIVRQGVPEEVKCTVVLAESEVQKTQRGENIGVFGRKL